MGHSDHAKFGGSAAVWIIEAGLLLWLMEERERLALENESFPAVQGPARWNWPAFPHILEGASDRLICRLW